MSDESADGAFDDARRAEVERPWRSARGVAIPTIGLAGAVCAASVVSTAAAVHGALPSLIAVPLHVVWAYLAFTPAHEASHGNVAGTNARLRWLETTVGWVGFAILALPYSMFRYLHLRHHSHTNDPENDPDLRASGGTMASILFGCFTVQWGYVRVLRRELDRGSPGAEDAMRGVWLYMAVSLVVLGTAVWFGFWKWLLLLWILPASIAQGCLALVFDWLPHHPHASRERYKDTRIILFPGLETLLLGQTHHLIHHLYPRLPFYRYSECFASVRPVLEAKGSSIVEPMR